MLLLAHFIATLCMTGIIWFVQIVHYPLFARIPAADFPVYEKEHVRRTGWVVGPPMLVEVGTALALLLDHNPVASSPAFLISLGVLLLVWIATALFSIPAHHRLETRYDPAILRRLVLTNWIRTLGWTARTLLLASLFI